MNFNFADKIEVTTDKNLVNALLKEGWFLVDVVATFKKEYSFLLVHMNESASKVIVTAK